MRKIISLICLLMPILSAADELVIRDTAPDQYTVTKGDTLWSISSKFLRDPWKWPEVWGINKENIKDPHWIYPGDVIVLDRNAKRLRIGNTSPATTAPIATGTETPATGEATTGTAAPDANTAALVPDLPPAVETDDVSAYSGQKTQKLRPKIRIIDNTSQNIATIPSKIIAPFLNKPLVIEKGELDDAPTLIGTIENRSIVSTGDTAFVINMPVDKGNVWQAFRPGRPLKDPESGDILGYEAVYLGDASVEKYDKISTLKITKGVLEILKGDHFIQSPENFVNNYVPRTPPVQISGKVISIFGGMDNAGQHSVIVLNKGRQDGLDVGHVLALYKESEKSKFKGEAYKLPALRYGLVFIFRTFERVSYAMVMEVQRSVTLNDTFETP